MIYAILSISSMFFYRMYVLYDDKFTIYEDRIKFKHENTFSLFLALNI